jgi:katanin p80 WD40 repeat-containing subunit B1
LGFLEKGHGENDEQMPTISAYNSPPQRDVNTGLAKSSLNSSRKNFQSYSKIEASEQPDENQLLQQIQNENAINDNSVANICNEEEYNKIFRPNNEIKRPTAKGSDAPKTPRKSDQSEKKVAAGTKEKDYFVDIKVAQVPQVKPVLSLAEPQVQPEQPEPKIVNSFEVAAPIPLINQSKSRSPKVEQVQKKPVERQQQALDAGQIIESGHESLMKALRNRFKNVQFIRTMWSNGSVKQALEAAVNLDDVTLMADLLSQINGSLSTWNLDICTILMPSIKQLIGSKYEEHMQCGAESCKIVLKNFGKLIKANVNNSNIGIDVVREERQRKCTACYSYLSEICNIIDNKQHTIDSTKLQNNFREINMLMKTME